MSMRRIAILLAIGVVALVLVTPRGGARVAPDRGGPAPAAVAQPEVERQPQPAGDAIAQPAAAAVVSNVPAPKPEPETAAPVAAKAACAGGPPPKASLAISDMPVCSRMERSSSWPRRESFRS